MLARHKYAIIVCDVYVCDRDLLQIPAGSMTVLAIMGPVTEVDKVTGHLQLL